MPFDSNDRADIPQPVRLVQEGALPSAERMGMTVAGETLTFIGMCERNGIDPASGLNWLLDDPEWFTSQPNSGS